MSSATPVEVVVFGERVAGLLRSFLGDDLVGAWFVGSIALGGYVPGQSDLDIAVACEATLVASMRAMLAEALYDVTVECPARGLELSVYRRTVASSVPDGADFEINVNGGPRMERTVRVSAEGQPGFWYVLDRAIAHRHGVVITGPPGAEVFADAPRRLLLDSMRASMRWHRIHERATLYSVLNAARAWRFAEEDVLGSKLDGATWARARWHDPSLIDAAVDLRYGRPADLDADGVDALLDHVERALETATPSRPDPSPR